MTMGAAPRSKNSTPTKQNAMSTPPLKPVLHQEKPRNQSFFVLASNVDITKKIRLSVEFPTQPNLSQPNDVSTNFKKLMTLLFAVDKDMSLLNWNNPMQNPITDAHDIQLDKKYVEQYFSGMRVLTYSKRITGFVLIQSPHPFWKTKQDGRLFGWLQKNKVDICTTTLSQSRHCNIGWLLYSHPEYTNQRMAIDDLQYQMKTRQLEFELVPHTIVHYTKDKVKMMTRALKV